MLYKENLHSYITLNTLFNIVIVMVFKTTLSSIEFD
ncbi:hypothetical protein SPPR111872_23335 [Sphingobacterium prati]